MTENLLSPFQDEKFNKTYRFVLMVTVFVFVYIFAITFIPMPIDAKDNVKTVLIFLLGYLSANGNYLTGGNPKTPAPPATAGPITGNDTVNVNAQDIAK